MQDNTRATDEFWDQLIQARSLSPELVQQHRESMNETPWVPLGRILIREGILSVKQVMKVVAIQADEPHLRIGDLAVREGFCTPEEIVSCLEIQRKASPGPIQRLVEDPSIAEPRLINALVGYIEFLEAELKKRPAARERTPAFA